VFRYYEATSADWQEKGIDDDHLQHVDTIGDTPEEKQMIKEVKLSCFQNISACSIKTKSFDEAALACAEVLKLDPENLQALYRRARSTALPINAGVPELQKAVKDLDQLIDTAAKIGDTSFNCAMIERERIQKMIEINLGRERKTYSKMFNPKKSVADFVIKKDELESDKIVIRSSEDKEFDKELAVIEKEVEAMI
jgi:hypothetical protein